MVMIDDATGHIFARFFENESWDSAARTLRGYASLHGLPRALYVDRHSISAADTLNGNTGAAATDWFFAGVGDTINGGIARDETTNI
jgi:hypothetical protein